MEIHGASGNGPASAGIFGWWSPFSSSMVYRRADMLTWFEWLKMTDRVKLSDGELRFLSAWNPHGIMAVFSYPVGRAIGGGLLSCLILLSWAREAVFRTGVSLTTGDGDSDCWVSGGNNVRRIMSQSQDPSWQGMRLGPSIATLPRWPSTRCRNTRSAIRAFVSSRTAPRTTADLAHWPMLFMA